MAVISVIIAQRAAELEDNGVCDSRPDVTSQKGVRRGRRCCLVQVGMWSSFSDGSMFLTEVVHLKLCPFQIIDFTAGQSPNTRLTVVFPVLSLWAGLVKS